MKSNSRYNKKVKTVDEYIKSFPKDVSERLATIRSIVKKSAPQATEKISYQMPLFLLNGRLVYFAGFAKHIGFYPFSSAINKFKKEVKGYKTSKGTVQFQHDEKLPLGLITKMVKFRVSENLSNKNK